MIERTFVDEAIKKLKAKEHIMANLEKAGVVDVNIQRTTLATRISVIAERPGLIIGRKGQTIRELSESVEKILGIENPQIEVVDVPNPALEPAVIAGWIKRALEKGLKPKKVIQRALEKVMSAGALGAEIYVKGKLAGKGAIARKERVAAGYMKKAGDTARKVKKVYTQALLKQGIIGIMVAIAPPDAMFTDKVAVKMLEEKLSQKGGENGNNKEEGTATDVVGRSEEESSRNES